MCDQWMPMIKLPLTRDQFRQLPRNPAYKYEYLSEQTYLSPRPRHYHALLDLRPIAAPVDPPVRPLRAQDWDDLLPIFAGAFRTTQPFGSLDDETRHQAARQALERTRSGGDGPCIEAASFVAPQGDQAGGAILITLLPAGDPCDWDSYYWPQPPPADCIARRLGRPHLTWVFVSPGLSGQGVGTALLAAAVNALVGLGFKELLTTFMIGNDASMLWHWRNGFRLLTHPGSMRRLHRHRPDLS
ncbi:MAG TPA: GNAT family N-acetyltransferase [Gemmataceae bacterium]|jgi:GNAT superfamily N-acetyltransferase|nr:GNAT family N-acetyltransferase [Gemmataceae bacterium]